MHNILDAYLVRCVQDVEVGYLVVHICEVIVSHLLKEKIRLLKVDTPCVTCYSMPM